MGYNSCCQSQVTVRSGLAHVEYLLMSAFGRSSLQACRGNLGPDWGRGESVGRSNRHVAGGLLE